MAEKCLTKCSTSLINRAMQIKTTLRFCLTSIIIAKINKTNDSSYQRLCGVKRTFFHCWKECQLMQSLWKSMCQYLRKMRIDITQNPAMPFLGMYPKNALSYTKTFFLNLLIIALLILARIWKQPRCTSTDEL